MSERLESLLRRLDAASDLTAGDIFDEIEAQIESDPAGSRPVVLAYQGDPGIRIRALGLVGDPQDFDTLEEALADPRTRNSALEALGHQPEPERVDAIARALLTDPDPKVRSRAAGLVAFHAHPGALASLIPLAEDPDRHVRLTLAWHLGKLGEPAMATLHLLQNDPDSQVRSLAARGLKQSAQRASPKPPT